MGNGIPSRPPLDARGARDSGSLTKEIGMKRWLLFLTVVCAALLSFAHAADADLLAYNNTYVSVANANGPEYTYDQTNLGAPAGTYYVGLTKSGGGLNALHISSTTGVANTVINTTSPSSSGTFLITDTGGQGYFDDIILMVAVTGTVSNAFSISLVSSGYNTSTDAYVPGAMYETFTNTNFTYGPQTYKPSPPRATPSITVRTRPILPPP